jgi:hypothetical protein
MLFSVGFCSASSRMYGVCFIESSSVCNRSICKSTDGKTRTYIGQAVSYVLTTETEESNVGR